MSTSTILYDGKITLEFDESSHSYTIDEKPVPSVTTILGVISKEALINWKLNEAIDYLRLNLQPGYVYDEVDIAYLLENAKRANEETSRLAKVIGTTVHEWIETYINNQIEGNDIPDLPLNPDAKVGCEAFVKWCEKSKVKWLESERKIYSLKYNYTGTMDALAVLNRTLVCVDFKTSKRLYSEYYLQVAAYAKAYEEETGNKIDRCVLLKIPKGNRKKPYVLERDTTMIDDNFEVFLNALELYRWKNS